MRNLLHRCLLTPHIAMCCLLAWVSCICGHVNCRYDATVGVNDQAPDSWLGEIEVTHLSYEAVPLLRKPFFNEVIHRFPYCYCTMLAACGRQMNSTSASLHACEPSYHCRFPLKYMYAGHLPAQAIWDPDRHRLCALLFEFNPAACVLSHDLHSRHSRVSCRKEQHLCGHVETDCARLCCSVLVISLRCSWRCASACSHMCNCRHAVFAQAALLFGGKCCCVTHASPLAAGTRAWKFGMDRIYKPFYNNLMISNKRANCCHEYEDTGHGIVECRCCFVSTLQHDRLTLGKHSTDWRAVLQSNIRQRCTGSWRSGSGTPSCHATAPSSRLAENRRCAST